MLNIAIDGKRFFLNSSGLGRYSRTLVHSLLSKESQDQISITLFKPRGKVRFQPMDHPRLHIITAEHRIGGNLGNGWWRFAKLPKLIDSGRFSIFHGPSHILPISAHCPMVVTMHDFTFLRYPQYFRLWDRKYYEYMFKKSAERADHIISISEATKNDLIDFFDIRSEKISVIYSAFDDIFKPLQKSDLLDISQKYSLPEQYVLYVGTIEPRKNILRVATAFDALISSGKIEKKTQFLIVGPKGWFYKNIIEGVRSLSHKEKIRFIGPVYDKDLAGIYQLATVMAYPSEFEGFGYPVLESMRLGTPVLTSRVSSLPEAGGDAALLVDPLNIDEIAAGMEKLIIDEDYRKDLIRKGHQHVEQFSPAKMVKQTMEIYQRFAQ